MSAPDCPVCMAPLCETGETYLCDDPDACAQQYAGVGSNPIWGWRRTGVDVRVPLYQTTLWGKDFGMLSISLWDCLAYLSRLRRRYPMGLPELEVEAPQKGGPWRWRLGEQTGVVHCSRKEDAITTLRHKWQRVRLPKGLTWELTRG